MTHFEKCPIEKDIVILASGDSINDIIKTDLQRIAKKYFVIAINFQDIIQPHMRVWSDANVTDWLDTTEKDCIWVTRSLAFHPKNTYKILDQVDYWFDNRKEFKGIDSNYRWTLYWLLLLIRKHFSDKKVYIFGMDCKDNVRAKYRGGEVIKEKHKDNNCEEMPEAFKTKKNLDADFFTGVYNMNDKSAVTCLEYKKIEDL